jgi:simple sugar transport system ATP-binding protein
VNAEAAVQPNEAPVVAVSGISKSFGVTRALRDVTMAVLPRESHALVGRNGAGKSTLVGVITGLIKPDAGEVRFNGEAAPGMADRTGWREQVACVYQKSTVIPSLTVAENLFLNAYPDAKAGLIRWRTMRAEGRKLLDEWGIDVDVGVDASRLDVGQRQLVEIARALRLGSRFIVLDEPTAQLKGSDIEQLFDHMRRLQESGVTFLYISHHLDEIHQVCQKVTVLRDGRHVTTARVDDLTTEDIVTAMVGRAAGEVPERHRVAAAEADAVLQVRGLGVGTECRDVDITVRRGEFVGLAGLAGSGKGHVADAIVGIVKHDRGEIVVGDAVLEPGDVAGSIAAGVGYVPQDRHARGFSPNLSIEENVTLPILRGLGRGGFVDFKRRQATATRLIEFLDVVGRPEQLVTELSGGNQQKTVMGRALSSDPKVLVLANPTAGVDIASKVILMTAIQESVDTAVLMVSDELDELALCDRVLVMFAGEIVGEFEKGWDEHQLVSAIEGI